MTYTKKHISPLPPSQLPGLGGLLGKAVGGVLTKNPIAMGIGAVAGGVGGFLNARQEAKAAGEKLTFKDAIGDVALGIGKGAINPINAGVGLVKEGIETHQQNQDFKREEIAQNASINQAPVFDPLAAATMRGLFKKQ